MYLTYAWVRRHLLPPQYSGRLTFRGTLLPSQMVTVRPKLWITRPGTYSLSGWRVETEVEEGTSSTAPGVWQTRQRYSQSPPEGNLSCVTVYDIQNS